MKNVIAAVLFLGISVVALGQAQPISSTPDQAAAPAAPAKNTTRSSPASKAKVHHTKAHHKAHKRHHKAA